MSRFAVIPDAFLLIRAEVQARFQGAKGSHDWEHTERVLTLARHIAQHSGAHEAIVQYAALLHDIARSEEDQGSGRVDHAQRGAEIAREILIRHGFPAAAIESITACIRTHRFRDENHPESLEAQVLFDADKLDSIGAVGIGRAFLFAGEIGAKLHNAPEMKIEQTLPYSEEDTAYREYMVKLRHVQERIFTAEGKRLAQERHDFMVAFFTRLQDEIQGRL